jgi:chemotaxis protein MotB
MAKRDPKVGITIIRREEIIEEAHHGGAWKVAYADFVTAMMAFFLLMWLLNATTEAQRRGLADYFSPSASVNVQRSGTGKPLGGQSPFTDGMAISDRGTVAVMNQNAPPVDEDDDGSDTLATKSIRGPGQDGADEGDRTKARDPTGAGQDKASTRPAAMQAQRAAEQARRQEQQNFAQAAAQMRRAIAADPDLAPIARQLAIDLTPEGLRVQIRDSEGLPMFANGSTEPNERARAVLKRLTPMLISLKEPVAIGGYTDATPYMGGAGRTNWDLSADRALATRRILTESGLPDDRIRDITGHGERDLLLPDAPLNASNRRIAILLMRSAPTAPASPSSPAP